MHSPYGALFLVVLLPVWMAFIMAIVSKWGGWSTLAERYRYNEPFTGQIWRFQCGQFRWPANYNNCLTVGADPVGLFIAVFPLFRIAHPPLFIPWRDISVTRQKVLWVTQVKFLLGRDDTIPFAVRESLAQKLRAGAGDSWPKEADPGR